MTPLSFTSIFGKLLAYNVRQNGNFYGMFSSSLKCLWRRVGPHCLRKATVSEESCLWIDNIFIHLKLSRLFWLGQVSAPFWTSLIHKTFPQNARPSSLPTAFSGKKCRNKLPGTQSSNELKHTWLYTILCNASKATNVTKHMALNYLPRWVSLA